MENENKRDCCKKCEPLKRVERSLSNYNIGGINHEKIIQFLIKHNIKKIPCIYSIRNIENDKRYIGSTNHFIRRLHKHFEDLKNRAHSSDELEKDYNENPSNFAFEILRLIETQEELYEAEQYYTDLYKTYVKGHGYNARIDVKKNTGVEFSESVRNQMSINRKGRKLTEEHKKKIGKGVKEAIVNKKLNSNAVIFDNSIIFDS